MELTPPGLLGAVVGIVLGLINYGVIVGFVTGRLRALDKSESRAEREEFERKLSLMRRIILWTDVIFFGGIGYWFGQTMAG